MGHTVHDFIFPIKTKKEDIMASCDDWANCNRDWNESSAHGLRGGIVFKDITFDTEAEAKSYLEKSPGYSQYAVKFKKPKTNKTLTSLQEREIRLRTEYTKLDSQNQFESLKSKFVSCKKCESRINKDYITANRCPCCHNDMRSETIKNRLIAKYNALKKVQVDLEKAKKEAAKKSAELFWMVHAEVHS